MTGRPRPRRTSPAWAATGCCPLPGGAGSRLFDAVARRGPCAARARSTSTRRARGRTYRALLRGLVRRPGRRAAHRGRRRAAGRCADGWPGSRRPSRAGPAGDLVRDTWPPCSATPGGRRVDAERGVPGPGLRLADRGRTAQPARRRHRPAAARHAGLRLPDPAALARPPARRHSAADPRRRHDRCSTELDTLDGRPSPTPNWTPVPRQAGHTAARLCCGSWARRPRGDGRRHRAGPGGLAATTRSSPHRQRTRPRLTAPAGRTSFLNWKVSTHG